MNKRSENKVSIGLVIAICIFLAAVTFFVIALVIKSNRSKNQVIGDQQPSSQTQVVENQPEAQSDPTQEPPTEQVTPVSNERAALEAAVAHLNIPNIERISDNALDTYAYMEIPDGSYISGYLSTDWMLDPNSGIVVTHDDVNWDDFTLVNTIARCPDDARYPSLWDMPVDKDSVAAVSQTITDIFIPTAMPEIDAQAVHDTYALYLQSINWNNPNHVVIVDGVIDGYYSCKDIAYGFDFWMYPEGYRCAPKTRGYGPSDICILTGEATKWYNETALTFFPGDKFEYSVDAEGDEHFYRYFYVYEKDETLVFDYLTPIETQPGNTAGNI